MKLRCSEHILRDLKIFGALEKQQKEQLFWSEIRMLMGGSIPMSGEM
jgi:hypothetical protein